MSEFPKIFDRLKKNFQKYEEDLTVTENNEENYSLEGPYSEKFKKPLWFGAVQTKKNYVSYHLMPVYMYKDLVKEIPENLKKRMQGKSCFNFNKYDDELFRQVENFTDRCYKEFQKRKDNV